MKGGVVRSEAPSDYLGQVPPVRPGTINRDPFKSREPLKLQLKLPSNLLGGGTPD